MKIRKSVNNFIHLFSANIFSQIVGVFALSYYVRVFTKEELAFLPAAMMLGGISNLLFNFGFFPTMVKVIPSLRNKNEEKIKQFFFTVLFFSVVGGLFFSIVVAGFSKYVSLWIFHNTLQSANIKILSIGLVFFSVWQFFTYVFRSLSEFKALSKIMIFQNLSRIVVIILLSQWMRELSIIIGVIFSIFASVVIALIYFRKYFFRFNGFYNFRELIKESFPFYLEGYIMYLQREGDNLIITSFLGAESLSIYFVAKKIYLFVYSAMNSLGNVLTSQMSTFRSDLTLYKKRLNEISNTYIFIIIPVFVFALSFSPYLLKIIAGRKFKEAILLGAFLGLVPLIQYFFGLNYGINVFLLDKPVNRVKFTTLNAVILIIFLAFFINLIGLDGVAIGRVLAPLAAGFYVITLSSKIPMLPEIKKGKAFAVFFITLIISLPNLFIYLLKINYLWLLVSNLFFLALFLVIVHFFFAEEFYGSLRSILSSNI